MYEKLKSEYIDLRINLIFIIDRIESELKCNIEYIGDHKESSILKELYFELEKEEIIFNEHIKKMNDLNKYNLIHLLVIENFSNSEYIESETDYLSYTENYFSKNDFIIKKILPNINLSGRRVIEYNQFFDKFYMEDFYIEKHFQNNWNENLTNEEVLEIIEITKEIKGNISINDLNKIHEIKKFNNKIRNRILEEINF